MAKLWFFIKLQLLKRAANKLDKKHGCEHFIVKSNGTLVIISRKEFKLARQKGVIKKSVNAANLRGIAIYSTRYDSKGAKRATR